MNFDEAAQRFKWLDQEYTSGRLTLEQYRAGLAECRVIDQYGRPWMPQERTGEWYVYINNQWVPGHTLQPQQPAAAANTPPAPQFNVPPVQQQAPLNQFSTANYPGGAQPLYPNPPSVQPGIQGQPYQQAAGSFQRPVNMVSSKGGMSVFLSLLFWFLGFGAAAVVLYLITEDPNVPLVVGAVSAFSLIVILINAASAWEGSIYDIRRVREQYRDSDGDRYTKTVTYAYIQQPNGKSKKVQTGRGWQVGDYVQKRRGETTPRLIKQS